MPAKKAEIVNFDEVEKQIKALQIPYNFETKEYPIEVLLFKFKSYEPEKSTIVIPSYQREFIWKDDMRSRYIESLLLGVPIQPLFSAVLDEDGTLEIIDGSQRLRTIEAFTKNEFKLKGLKKLDTLNGLTYADFSLPRKNKFELINIRIHVVNEKADLSIRQDIFDRINTSGEKAKPSELRKGGKSGSFYTFVMECTENELFNLLCPINKDAKKRGEAEELILRFFAYSDLGTNNKQKGSRLLDDYLLKQNKQHFNQENKKRDFEQMLNFVQEFFEFGFKKTASSNSTPRVRFEAISLGVYFALKVKPNLRPTYMKWLHSVEFRRVTTSDSSGNTGRLTERVEFVKNCLLNQTKEDQLTYENS